MDILDDAPEAINQNWDPKERVRLNDAIIEANDNLKKVTAGRYLLFGLAVINLLMITIEYFSAEALTPDMIAGYIAVIVVVVLPYGLFGVLYPRKPLLFLILGLVLYLIFLVLGSLMLGQSLVQGFLWKAVKLSLFGFGIQGIVQWNKYLNKLKGLGFPAKTIEEAKRKLLPINRLRKNKVK